MHATEARRKAEEVIAKRSTEMYDFLMKEIEMAVTTDGALHLSIQVKRLGSTINALKQLKEQSYKIDDSEAHKTHIGCYYTIHISW